MDSKSKGRFHVVWFILLYLILAVFPGVFLVVIQGYTFQWDLPLTWIYIPLPFPLLALTFLRIARIEPLWRIHVERRIVGLFSFIAFLLTAYSIYGFARAIHQWFNPVVPPLPDLSGTNQPYTVAYVCGWFGGFTGGLLILLLGYLHSLRKSPKVDSQLPPA